MIHTGWWTQKDTLSHKMSTYRWHKWCQVICKVWSFFSDLFNHFKFIFSDLFILKQQSYSNSLEREKKLYEKKLFTFSWHCVTLLSVTRGCKYSACYTCALYVRVTWTWAYLFIWFKWVSAMHFVLKPTLGLNWSCIQSTNEVERNI